MGDYSYLPQQSEEHFKAYNKNDLNFIELNLLPSWQRNNTPLPLFRDNAQDPIEWLDDFERAVTANQYDDKYKFQIMSTNARKNNISFTIQFENKFRTPILISKWCMELERKTQGSGEIVTKYAKAIRKLIKRVDSGRNWTEKQKIHFFTKRLRTDLSYALWPFLALKDNPTIDMTIELAQQIEDNQKMHLGFTLPVFALVSVMAPTPQMAATSFAAQTQDPNEQLIDRLTANLAWLLELLAQAGESASQSEENPFYTFNLTNDNHDIDELAINTTESTKKKKKAKVDFVLDSNKASTSTADNNKPPKAKVFKNFPKLEPPEIIQKSGPCSVVKDLMETPAHIIFGQLMTYAQFRKELRKSLIPKKKTPKTNKCPRQAGLADNSNFTPLICKAQVAGYFIDLILDSGSSVSVIAKHFFEAIGRKIDEPFTQPMTNIYGDKKKGLGIAKAIPVHINSINIETDMEVSKAKEYTIIVGNKWLKKAKVLLDYELCELTIRCGEKLIVVKCRHWTTPPATKQNQKDEQSEESDDEESNEENEEQKETAELVYTTFTNNDKPLDNVKANKKRIIVNDKLICWPYYDILRRTFDQKPGKKAKYSYWRHGSCAQCWCNKLLYSLSDECKSCLIYYKDWKPISLIPRDELKEVQKFFENEPPEIQSLIVKQKEPSLEEKKIDIENLLARNSPVILKESDTPRQTHMIQHTITTKETCPIYLKPYQSNHRNDKFIKKEIN
ncbi:hypothetical protein G9A89_002526 [Geosiphon pyriformis]|nr:hypothetical protein G9A89_002526 [Geosiphon pyriformis]